MLNCWLDADHLQETIVLFGVCLESLISFPRLESLLLIGVNQLFQQKLITDLTADKVANLKTLAWKGDVSAELEFFEPFLHLSNIREIELTNNAFNTVPDLTNCSSLSSISLSYEAPYLLTNQLSINLPLVGDPRNGLKVQISCILCREEHSISRLQGRSYYHWILYICSSADHSHHSRNFQ